MNFRKVKLKKSIRNVGKIDERLGEVLNDGRWTFKSVCSAMDEWCTEGRETMNPAQDQDRFRLGQQKVLGEIARFRQTLDVLEKETEERTGWNEISKKPNLQKSSMAARSLKEPEEAEA